MKQCSILKFINLTIAFLWIYQGLIPKLLFINADEIAVWQWLGLNYDYAKLVGQCSGIIEIIFGLLFVLISHKYLHYLSIIGLIALFFLIVLLIPDTLIRAFNPMVMNLSMISLSVVYLMLVHPESSKFSPS